MPAGPDAADGRCDASRNTAPTKPVGTCDSRAVPSFRFILEYDGSDFAGWQRQSQGERTVQATFEAALGELVGAAVQVRGSGRTDTGVHALGQVASATFETTLDAETLRRALNARLPGDIAVREAANVPSDFDARRSATDARRVEHRQSKRGGEAVVCLGESVAEV